MDDVLLQIAEACLHDERLIEVVKSIASMAEVEKELFRTKLKVYFLNKTGETDLQAYEFFRILLQENNAKRVLELLKEKFSTS
ncbi:hypothetical protein [Pseudothermotoga sp.]|uniref:hypothetical protein n=1 Tax=Pseudothermotoga sp. TaxID=2033661 RepID=UPI0031F63912